MGIHGLLPQLKSIMVPIHIKQFEGCYVAVDTYSWLHKGAFSCSAELCKGLPTSRHIEYCMRKVNLLRHYGVKPILVFDGGLLPMKSEQENKRARVRKENLARAVEHEADGNSAAAFECYQKAVDISPLIAAQLIQVLKQENVNYIVAPYEADAQMTFLAISKQVEAVITEDSDLIPFGCPRIIFKMDKLGQGVEFQYSMLQKNKELSFEGFNRKMLLEMCILSGCDYLQSLPGMGLKRAHAIIKKFKSYDKVLKHLRFSGVSVPPSYEDSFKKAILTFQYQRVYDPISEDIVHLSDIPADIARYCFITLSSYKVGVTINNAHVSIETIAMSLLVDNLTAGLAVERTSQLKISPEIAKKKIDLPVQKNLLTKYFSLKGFASLEAKRKFRAPRMSPTSANQTTLDSPSVSPQDNDSLEVAATETKSSAASLVDSEILGNVPPVNNHIEDRFSTKIIELTESSSHDLMGKKRKSSEHTILQQPMQPIHKPCLGLQREHEDTNVKDTVEGKTREATRKVIVRSAYFQHKRVEKNNSDKKQDCLVNSDMTIDVHKNTISDSANHHMESKVLKRKISPNDSVQSENLRPRHIHPVSSFPDNGYCDQKSDRTFTEDNAEEGKFGANISHLDRYSQIAEKSMEKFVSVISSFRCSSSGSRASGLRAPLRDVQNTSNNRPATLDFKQYAYVPNKQKNGRKGC
ncbi:exonuclease 1 isoform X2 [Senna tora]|uniref:Exonuclease 1 n=1 Tax=Senna tora TaxID=362788 RepID=A0A834XB53_9FABA|nr:exonuclease 1 isoform X2 [Senna tora]